MLGGSLLLHSNMETGHCLANICGVLVTVVDEAAGDFVFGPHGTIGRPQGLMTPSIIDKIHSAKLLSSACEKRWLAFPQIWRSAGWSPTSLVDFVSRLRPLQYRNDLDENFISFAVLPEIICMAMLLICIPSKALPW
ncbi:TPA: hypothetical protein ACH3X1_007279 [Trebouxia sp. C0004]